MVDKGRRSAFPERMNPARSSCRLVVILLGLCQQAPCAQPWTEGPGFRSMEVRPPSGGKPGFTLLSARETGIAFTNELRGDLYLTNAVAHNGAGVALGDVDGDGWVDLYFCNPQG